MAVTENPPKPLFSPKKLIFFAWKFVITGDFQDITWRFATTADVIYLYFNWLSPHINLLLKERVIFLQSGRQLHPKDVIFLPFC